MFSLLLAAAATLIDRAILSNDIKILASDEFEGRGPGTAGEQKTVDYLIGRFKEAGAGPAGENGGWTQAVEMQRAAIARSLMTEPALLLADEPTGNLDTETGLDILKLLRGLNSDDGLTIVMITHDESIAAGADHTWKMKDGRVEDDRAKRAA